VAGLSGVPRLTSKTPIFSLRITCIYLSETACKDICFEMLG
jgi:hypothetical protein